MFLTKEEQEMCDGEYGETIRKSMDILVALGDIYGASGLVDITSAQVSGVSYKTIGDAGLEYLQDLARDGSGKATINASLNPPGTDLDNWEELGFPRDFAIKQNEIVDAYADLGISKTCTCTPYLVGNVPRYRDHVSWSESSAVAYVNSVIGARTNREGGPAALAAAIVGKTPLYGFHLDENRKANLVVNVSTELKGADFGALGYIIGKVVGGGVPYFKLQNAPNNNNLKTLGAALASSGSVALYHMENITPEYQLAGEEDPFRIALTAVFVEGILFIVLSFFKFREQIINSIPQNLKYGISAGIGLFIAFIAIMPALASLLDVQQAFSQFFGGTSLLILVGVVIDTIQQIQSHLMMRHYDGLLTSGRTRPQNGVSAY